MHQILTKLRKFSISTPLMIGIVLGVLISTSTLAALRGSSIFSDVPAGTFGDDAIGRMYELGIMRGYPDGRFGKDDPVTREQLAVMFDRFRSEMLRQKVPSSSSSDTSVSSSSSVSSMVSSSSASVQSSSVASSSSISSSSSSSVSSKVTIPPQGAIRFTAGGFTVNENAGSASLSVVRTGGRSGTVVVTYTMTGGTARPGVDYPLTTGTLTFASGESSKTFSVPIADNTLADGPRTVMILLRNPQNGAILAVPSEATVTINDNEGGVAASASSTSSSTASSASSTAGAGILGFSANSFAAGEATGPVTITVNRTNGSAGIVSVNYATSNGTAGASDYTGVSGTLTFGSGETSKTFTVTPINDTDADGNKTANLTLSNVTGGATIAMPNVVTLTLMDDEVQAYGSGAYKFASTSVIGRRSEGKVILTVQRVSGAKGTTSVNYSTFDNTAKAGVEYTASAGTITFGPGEASKTITITLNPSASISSDKNFSVSLSGVTGGATLLDPTAITVNLAD